VLILPVLMGTVSVLPDAVAAAATVIVLLAFALGWAGLGVSALRLDRRGIAAATGAAMP
jgi:hypothetical protein